MSNVATLVPGFQSALEMLPGMLDAYGKLARSLEDGRLSARGRAQIGVVVAASLRCDYCRWVMGRLAEHAGLNGEDILFASMGLARERREAVVVSLAQRIVTGAVTPDRVRMEEMQARLVGEVELSEIAAHVALAVLTCSVLQALAPGRVPARKEA